MSATGPTHLQEWVPQVASALVRPDRVVLTAAKMGNRA